MADHEDGIFSNLPQRRRRLADDDNTRSFFREALGMYVPEGPLPPRPHQSGKGRSFDQPGCCAAASDLRLVCLGRRRQRHDVEQWRADGGSDWDRTWNGAGNQRTSERKVLCRN